MEMPRPTAAHRQLELLAGAWAGEERIHPTPFDPAGGTARGRFDNRLAIDGFAVVQDYEQERGGAVAFRAHGVFRYDSREQSYVLHWFDSMGESPQEFRGTFEDGVLVLICRNAQGQFRASWDFCQAGRCTFRMDASPDGQQWFPFLEGAYTRRS
jgi:hypothetical protein